MTSMKNIISLNFKHCSLIQEGYEGVGIGILDTLGDFETKSFLRTKFIYSEYVGAPILHHQIKKTFSLLDSQKIISRNSIKDLITALSNKYDIEKLYIPIDITSFDSIYKLLANECNASKDTLLYITDIWGLDYSKLNFDNLIILSSIESILGIAGINYGWVILNNNDVFEYLSEYQNRLLELPCSLSEIYTLIAIRNYIYIKKLNDELIAKNRKSIEISAISKNAKFSYLFPKCIIKIDNALEIAKNLKEQRSILVNTLSESEIVINYGKKQFAEDFYELKDYITSYNF
jgi:hypothetical protein